MRANHRFSRFMMLMGVLVILAGCTSDGGGSSESSRSADTTDGSTDSGADVLPDSPPNSQRDAQRDAHCTSSTPCCTDDGHIDSYISSCGGAFCPEGTSYDRCDAESRCADSPEPKPECVDDAGEPVEAICENAGERDVWACPDSPPGGDDTPECDNPADDWIWCDDFEEDRLSSYFEYSDAGGSFVRSPGDGIDGSHAMSATFAAGQSSAGNLHLAFGRTPSSYFSPVDDGTRDFREVYWRMYVKHEAGWVGGGGDKLSRATIFAGDDWSQAMIAHIWSGSDDPGRDYLVADPASGTDTDGNVRTTQYNDFDNLRWLGAKRGQTPLFGSEHVGQWYCVEAHVRLNDAGQSNGVFEFWIDGNLEAQSTDLNWVGAYDAYGINAVYFENYWNAGSPTEQTRYFDNIVVSQSRIGCE